MNISTFNKHPNTDLWKNPSPLNPPRKSHSKVSPYSNPMLRTKSKGKIIYYSSFIKH